MGKKKEKFWSAFKGGKSKATAFIFKIVKKNISAFKKVNKTKRQLCEKL